MLGTLSPLSRSSEFWRMNLSVKEGRNLARTAEVAVAEPVTLSSFSDSLCGPSRLPCPARGKGEGSAVLIPLFCEMPSTEMPFFGLWVGSRFIGLICVWASVTWIACHIPLFSDKALVGIVIFLLGPEKPREVNRKRPLPWRDQYPQLWIRSNKMMLGYPRSHSFSLRCFRWINDFYPKKWPKWFIVVLLLWQEPQIKCNLKAKRKTFFCVVGSGCFETWCLGKAGHLWH